MEESFVRLVGEMEKSLTAYLRVQHVAVVVKLPVQIVVEVVIR